MRYECQDCDFKTDEWIFMLSHAFKFIGHSVCRTDGGAMNTSDNNPV